MSLSRLQALRRGCALALLAACTRSPPDDPGARDEPRPAAPVAVEGLAPALRLAVISDLEGVLEPCGCTPDSLGGVDRLGHVLEALRAEASPLLVLAAGSLLTKDGADPAREDASTTAQEQLEADAVAAVLEALQVDAAAPSPRDLAQRWAPLRNLLRDRRVALLASTPPPELEDARPWIERQLGAQRVVLAREESLVQTSWPASTSGRALVVTAAHGTPSSRPRHEPAAPVDVRVLTGLAQARSTASVRDGTLELTGATEGRELTLVELWPGGARGASWRLVHDRPRVTRENLARLVRYPLHAGVPSEPVIRRFLDQLFARIDALHATREPAADENARDPSRPVFVGSRTCAACHTEAYHWWRGTPHARAFHTLRAHGRALDLDCIGCHVTGYGQPGGARLGRLSELQGVGCESCHGPGSQHVESPLAPQRTVSRSAPEALCQRCHDTRHSADFRYQEKQALLRAPGHGTAPPGRRVKQLPNESGAP